MKQKFIFTILALVLALGLAVSSNAQSAAGQKTQQQVVSLGSTQFTGPDPNATFNPNSVLAGPQHDRDLVGARLNSITGLVTPPLLTFPTPGGTPTAGSNPGFNGFNGLNSANDPPVNGGFVFEPPDQGLAVGNGFIVEGVNSAMAVYDKSGNLLKGPTGANTFFKVDQFQFLSDPKCYFDQPTHRFFCTIFQIDVGISLVPVPHLIATGHSHVLIAVSQTSNPTLLWNVFALDTTDDGSNGTPAHPDCPCFADQPLIGANKDGFYVSTNEFSIFGDGFNGAQIYALSKKKLVNSVLPTAVHFGNLALAEGIAFSVQPATSPKLNDEEERGVEYLVSTLDFFGTLDNRLAVWAITGTDDLNNVHPDDVELHKTIITSEVYGVPPDAVQKDGPRPFGNSLHPPRPAPFIQTDDDRMQQVVFADGKLFTAVTTVIQEGANCITGFDPDCHSGIAWFIIKPDVDDDKVEAKIHKQGYVSLHGNFVYYPSIGVDEDGKGLMTFSLSGADFFPSVGYVKVDKNGVRGRIHIAAPGVAAADGFTGYFGSTATIAGHERWGDYSAAVADGEGNIWFASEYVSGGKRTRISNWATFVGQVHLPDSEDDD